MTMLRTATNEGKVFELFEAKEIQSIALAKQELIERRQTQEEIHLEFKKVVNDDVVEDSKLSQISAVRSLNVDASVKSQMISLIEESVTPQTNIFFEGNSQTLLNLVVISTDGSQTKYPLSDLAIENTLAKFFNVNQRTIDMVSGTTKAMILNEVLNRGKEASTRGRKKIRLNCNGEIRSMHSNQYKYLDHIEVLDIIERELLNMTDTTITLDEKYMYFESNIKEEVRDGDATIKSGLAVMNSEVGLSSLQVFASLNVGGVKILAKPKKDRSFREVHKGFDVAASLEGFANSLVMTEEYLESLVEKYKALVDLRINSSSISSILRNLSSKYLVLRSKKIQEEMKQFFESKAASRNLYFVDIISLISRGFAKRKEDSLEKRIEYAIIAGDLLTLTDDEIVDFLA